jgi:hypothetical protein
VQQAPDRAQHLLGQLLAVGGGGGTDDAVARVLAEQGQGDLVERRLGRRDLGEDVDAVALLLDHPLQAADLARDPPQPVLDLVLVVDVAGVLRVLGHLAPLWGPGGV